MVNGCIARFSQIGFSKVFLTHIISDASCFIYSTILPRYFRMFSKIFKLSIVSYAQNLNVPFMNILTIEETQKTKHLKLFKKCFQTLVIVLLLQLKIHPLCIYLKSKFIISVQRYELILKNGKVLCFRYFS